MESPFVYVLRKIKNTYLQIKLSNRIFKIEWRLSFSPCRSRRRSRLDEKYWIWRRLFEIFKKRCLDVVDKIYFKHPKAFKICVVNLKGKERSFWIFCISKPLPMTIFLSLQAFGGHLAKHPGKNGIFSRVSDEHNNNFISHYSAYGNIKTSSMPLYFSFPKSYQTFPSFKGFPKLKGLASDARSIFQ